MTSGFKDPETGFFLPHPHQSPFPPLYKPDPAGIQKAMAPLILSASGWRKVFAASGSEEDTTSEVSLEDRLLCAGMAWVYLDLVLEESQKSRPRIALGMDSRFTGPIISDVMTRVLLSRGAEVQFLGIVAAPEIMALVQTREDLDGFVYVSASHNPVGHNGVKFGLSEGGVIGGYKSSSLIDAFRKKMDRPQDWQDIIQTVNHLNVETLFQAYQQIPQVRSESRKSYFSLNREIFTLETEEKAQTRAWDAIRSQIKSLGLGVVAEFNGSARGVSIDLDFLTNLGVKVKTLNEKPRQFVHRIVPEGKSLDLCRQELEKAHKKQKAFVLGYVPDCDGDRGNLVFFNDHTQKVEILEAQEIFALCVLSELSGLVYSQRLTYDETGYPHQRMAVVCNDPTSLRIDQIAQAFKAQVFRAEVGEANVVNLARQLRMEEWVVRILGEGSNGGNITHPGSVRDPLSTLGSVLKLLALRSEKGRPGLFEIWCEKSGQKQAYKPDYTLADIIATLPKFLTTSAYEDRAMLRIHTGNPGQLKAAYEKHFVTRGWPDNQAFLRDELGIWAWEEVNYEGTEEKRGFGPPFRTGKETGGLKILLKNHAGQAIGSLWMRGSGTEPVFRVMADIQGSDPFKEEWLLNWHVGMIRRVD